MDIIHLIVGIFMIGIGFLVKSSPGLIAGYNTMSNDKKKNVDIEGLSTFMRNGFIAIGIMIIIGYFGFKWIGFTMIANSMILIATLGGVTILVIKAQQFDHNSNKQSKLTYWILGFVIVFTVGLIAYGFVPSKASFDQNTMQFSGMYGFEMKTTEIETIELTDTIPQINLRTNGFSFGPIKKGYFQLEAFGKSRLLVHSDKPPYVILTNTSGQITIINFKDKKETIKVFEQLKQLINK